MRQSQQLFQTIGFQAPSEQDRSLSQSWCALAAMVSASHSPFLPRVLDQRKNAVHLLTMNQNMVIRSLPGRTGRPWTMDIASNSRVKAPTKSLKNVKLAFDQFTSSFMNTIACFVPKRQSKSMLIVTKFFLSNNFLRSYFGLRETARHSRCSAFVYNCQHCKQPWADTFWHILLHAYCCCTLICRYFGQFSYQSL